MFRRLAKEMTARVLEIGIGNFTGETNRKVSFNVIF